MPKNTKKFENKTICQMLKGYDAFWLSQALPDLAQNILYIVSNGFEIEQVATQLAFFAPDIEILKFPAWDTMPYDRVSPNAEIIATRIDTLDKILHSQQKKQKIIIASIGAVLQKLPPKQIFMNTRKIIKIGDTISLTEFINYLQLNGYNRVEQVMENGEYAVRGDIIDVFPIGTKYPLRIDLFGDEIEKIRFFDAYTQRSNASINTYTFQVANEVILNQETIKTFRTKYREFFGANGIKDAIYTSISEGQKYIGMENWLPLFYQDNLSSIFDYLPDAQVIFGNDTKESAESKVSTIIEHFQARLEAVNITDKISETEIYRPVLPELFYLNTDIFSHNNAIFFTHFTLPQNENNILLNTLPMRNFYTEKNISLKKVYEDLQNYLLENNNLKRVICCNSAGSRDRIINVLQEYGFTNLLSADTFAEIKEKSDNKHIIVTVLELEQGFRDEEYCIISEQDIFGEKQNHKQKKKTSAKDTILNIDSISIGELVVHIEHGVGRFMGLENLTIDNAPHDCLKILYANNDKLFVPVENINVISKYGSDDENIQLDSLGGTAWNLKKAKVKEKIKEIAEKLIKIAAIRNLKKADIFIPEHGIFEDFCAKFPYNETDDQHNAISDVLDDLSAGKPMDRLICGDVGFGKTEIALRAAFTVAENGAQVAVVVPTTLLARQHYLNFKERMQNFPIKVRMLSRLVSTKEAKETKQGLENGSIEIVIGTHALLAKDIKFCNLGLLIIDEEQHFGVAHKERLKTLKEDVHILTLTATPIPRTLQLSLTGVKSLSVIATPPVDRLAVRSFLIPFDSVMIKEAVYREKYREGQTFFVCPRISDLLEVHEKLKKLLPDIKIAIAHGQMSATQLDDIMTDFSDKKYDMLLSTTIIESGIDLPNVNTMIIYRADMFGMAQLYQLKGRIGRAKKRGYCYFTIPNHKKLTATAEKRLNILQALDSLGAGFSLASHDMDIRGAGNILGEEQSGHIKDVGVALYHHLLEEEIIRQKSLADGDMAQNELSVEWMPQITTGIPIMIPENYVQDLGIRLGLYRRIGNLKDKDEISDMREELIDRFGPVPQEIDNLLKTIEIKQLCYTANIEKIDAGMKGILIDFHNKQFAKPDKLIEFVIQSFGKIKIRPDQKLLIEGDFSSYATRIAVIKQYVDKLVELAN